ncbi:MAG: tetratricopeptide repeat protein [Bdellovibrionia bacterium]
MRIKKKINVSVVSLAHMALFSYSSLPLNSQAQTAFTPITANPAAAESESPERVQASETLPRIPEESHAKTEPFVSPMDAIPEVTTPPHESTLVQAPAGPKLAQTQESQPPVSRAPAQETARPSEDSGPKLGTPSPTETPASSSSMDSTRALLAQMAEKIQVLEAKISSLNDKIDAQHMSLTFLAQKGKGPRDVILTQKAPSAGLTPDLGSIPGDPEGGFAHGEAIELYREALVLLRGQKYPESTLAFAHFLEKYPDHPLSGSAQFYIGECYFKQNEMGLALQEYQRVLSGYPQSPRISETLKQIALTEEALKKPEASKRHQQLLLSVFPHSPAAASFNQTPRVKETPSTEQADPDISSGPDAHSLEAKSP